MSFKDDYTTADLTTSDTSPDKKEKKKIVLSNDAMAIGQMLECLINKMVK